MAKFVSLANNNNKKRKFAGPSLVVIKARLHTLYFNVLKNNRENPVLLPLNFQLQYLIIVLFSVFQFSVTGYANKL